VKGIVLRAKYDSAGFLGINWTEGMLTPELSIEDLNDPAIIHFETLDGEEANTLVEQPKTRAKKETV
jgi:hypothetical protein